jgi:uncharacterized protein
MNVTLTGATGFIGRRLLTKLAGEGHEVWVLGRKQPRVLPAGVRFSSWDASDTEPPQESLATADAVIHLAGEPVSQRWTPEAKRRIRGSRVDGTRNLVRALSVLAKKPKALICGSAIGIYGSRGDEVLTEQSPPGEGFLAATTAEWEAAADSAEALGLRVVKIRTGIALGADGGALAKLLPIFRLGTGGKIGSGRQWMSWIHVDDVVRLFLLALDNSSLRGPLNATAPNPVTNEEFTRELGRAVHRPAIVPVPEFGLKLLYGEMASMVLEGQRVVPQTAAAAQFEFRFPTLAAALADIVG